MESSNIYYLEFVPNLEEYKSIVRKNKCKYDPQIYKWYTYIFIPITIFARYIYLFPFNTTDKQNTTYDKIWTYNWAYIMDM